jgi:HSF-type DNA-binding
MFLGSKRPNFKRLYTKRRHMQTEPLDKSAQGKTPENTPSTAGSGSYNDYCFSMPPQVEPIMENQVSPRFPEKLFALLDRAEAEGFTHILSWQPHGRCFVVQDRETFKGLISALMPGMTRLKSFQRQLNQWGFTRLTKGRDANGLYHELFLRYRPHLLRQMRRGGNSNRSTGRADAATPPNFYVMPFLTPLESNVSRGYEGVPLTMALTRIGRIPKPSVPTDHAASISMSDNSDNVGVDLLDHAFDSSIGADRASSATIDDMGGGRADQFVPRRWRRQALCFEASDSLAQIDQTHLYSMIYHQEERAGSECREIDWDQELEPRPLPPVITRVGEVVFPSYSPMPVSHHPGFTQIGPREFLFQGQGVDEPEELAGP